MSEDSPSLDTYQQGIPQSLPDPSLKKKRLRVVIILMLVLVAGLSAFSLVRSSTGAAILGRGDIVGQVQGPDRQPVPAEMVILGTDLKNSCQPDGSFRFSDVPAGQVTLVIGWQGQAVEVPALVPAGGQVDVGTIQLQSTLTP